MKAKIVIKYILRVICILAAISIVYSITDSRSGDMIKYEGDKYVPIEFGQDIFMYYCNEEEYSEEGQIMRVKGASYDMLLCEGDLYCIKNEVDAATTYYADDANYEWFAVMETEEDSIAYPISVTAEEMAYLNSIEDQPKETAVFFEEIEEFATLTKTSKDGMVSGVTELAYYDGSWYWRSEIIDENREKDGTWPEYIHKLPDSLSNKITEAIK